jgi:mannose-6-phosphate isomerase-like protein (cupin superfamily)
VKHDNNEIAGSIMSDGTKTMTRDEMMTRVARWKDQKPNGQMFVDTRLPEYERDLYSIIGQGVSEDPDNPVAITDVEGFHMAYIGCEPGKGASLHSHPTVEVFIPVTGKWSIYWNEGEAGEEVILEPMDCVSVPPGVMRGFYNAGTEHALMIGIVGGTDATKVEWPAEILDRARATGLRLDADGNILEASAAE